MSNLTREERARHASMARNGKNRLVGQGHPFTSDIDYTRDEVEFLAAIDRWKRKADRQFPTWREVLQVVKGLGYAKPFTMAEDPETTPPAEGDEIPWRAADGRIL